MWCPKCYGTIDKRTQRCKSCGFNLKSMEGATHSAVKQARKDGLKEDVLYTTKLPSDIKKKKLLLLCIFLGMFGGHSFYAGKIWKGIYSLIAGFMISVFAITIATLKISIIAFGEIGIWIYSVSILLQGINLCMWLFDLIAIIRNKYKISVYKPEFSQE